MFDLIGVGRAGDHRAHALESLGFDVARVDGGSSDTEIALEIRCERVDDAAISSLFDRLIRE